METMTKKERMYARIEMHGAKLNKIFNTPFDNVTLCKKLRRLEAKAHRLAEQYCNGDIDSDIQEVEENKILKQVAKILGSKVSTKDGLPTMPLFVNRDPRGYALKIDDEYVREYNLDIERDWGGYGLIAPEFDGE